MLTPSSPVAPPFSIASTNAVRTAAVDADARAAVQAQRRAGAANEARVADAAAAQADTRRAATAIPDPMVSLSTVAVAGAMHSLPAALGMLQRIALASASGTLSDADQQSLQAEHAQLTAKVVSSVGSVGAGEQPQGSTTHDDSHDDHKDARRDDGSRRPPVPPLQAARAGAPTAQAPTADAPASSTAPPARFDAPALPAHAESHVATRPTAAQAAQVTHFVQVTQTGHAPPLGVA